MSMWRSKLVTAIAAMVLALATTHVDAACCSSCIGQTADSVYDYDPVVYDQCKLKPNGARVCCFDCGTWSEPDYGNTVSYASDGTTPTVKAGTWVTLQWSNAKKVTYLSLKENQKKTVTATVNDTAATMDGNFYMICAKSKGSIVVRAWGADTCRQASPEKTIMVLEGDAGASCDAKSPTLPTAAPMGPGGVVSDDANVKNCNLNRASIKEVDGKQTCVCVSDWSGAPACDQMPAWKWIITIGGGIAALLSIVISVRAFMNSRKKKEEANEEQTTTPVPVKDDVETLRIGGDRQSTPSKNIPYKRGYDDNHGVYKMNDREFSL